MCKPSENARNYEAGEKRRCAVGLGYPWRALVLFGDGVGNRTCGEEHDADAVREWPCKPEKGLRAAEGSLRRESSGRTRACARGSGDAGADLVAASCARCRTN